MPKLNHPQGLATLFFAEMWERFSYYGMRALLILYLVNAIKIPREQALELYATYTGLVYLTPILGGYFADRWLGYRTAIVVGGILMALGHFAMAFESLIYMALGLLIIGNGFFKPNISTLLGSLYAENDPRRDGGFTIFYMGINLGAFLSPLVCGTLADQYGWHYGFAAAGVGMVIGLLIFLLGTRRMPISVETIPWVKVIAVVLITITLLVIIISSWRFIQPWWQGVPTLGKVLCFSLLALVFFDFRPLMARLGRDLPLQTEKLTLEEKQRTLAIIIIAFFVIFFWMGFEQAGGTMNLFADKQTDRDLWGWEFHASYFQSLNPLFILVLAPLFALLWSRWDSSRFRISVVVKQGLGMILLGLGFVVMAVANQHATAIGLVSPLWLVVVYFLHTVGELMLSPIGLSMVTKLAPVRIAALMMGLWFGAMAVASYLAGTLEAILKHSEIPLFWFLVMTSVSSGLLLILASAGLRKLMGNRA